MWLRDISDRWRFFKRYFFSFLRDEAGPLDLPVQLEVQPVHRDGNRLVQSSSIAAELFRIAESGGVLLKPTDRICRQMDN